MLEHLKAEDRSYVLLGCAYRIVGRIALIVALRDDRDWESSETG